VSPSVMVYGGGQLLLVTCRWSMLCLLLRRGRAAGAVRGVLQGLVGTTGVPDTALLRLCPIRHSA
jgi:hypothetical protein